MIQKYLPIAIKACFALAFATFVGYLTSATVAEQHIIFVCWYIVAIKQNAPLA